MKNKQTNKQKTNKQKTLSADEWCKKYKHTWDKHSTPKYFVGNNLSYGKYALLWKSVHPMSLRKLKVPPATLCLGICYLEIMNVLQTGKGHNREISHNKEWMTSIIPSTSNSTCLWLMNHTQTHTNTDACTPGKLASNGSDSNLSPRTLHASMI